MSKTVKQKNLLIGGLLAVVLIMAVGYAAFATQLNITGTASFDNTWCIGFDSRNTSAYQATAGVSGGTVPTGSISFDGNTCATNYKTDASLTANFKQPGDKIVYTLTIANKSTLTAAIKSIKVEDESVTSNKTITKGNVKYTVEMPETTTLSANATTTMKVTAEFQNDTDINKYTTGETQTIDVEINAEQDDGNGGMVVTNPYNGTIYRWSTTPLAIKGSSAASYDQITISSLTKGTDYITEADYPTYSSRVTALGKQYYLKHTIVNDEITESSVCFVYNNSEHCLRGQDSFFETNKQIIKEYQTFYNLSDVQRPMTTNPGCSYTNGALCFGGDFGYVSSYSNGNVEVGDLSSVYCFVQGAGRSLCGVD